MLQTTKPGYRLQFNCRIVYLQLLWHIMFKVASFVIYDELSCGSEMGYKIARANNT